MAHRLFDVIASRRTRVRTRAQHWPGAIPGRIVFTVVVCLSLSAGVAASWVSATRPFVFTAKAAATQNDPEPSHSKDVVVVYVTPYGFEPAETGARAGDHILVIRNSSGLTDLNVQAAGLALTQTVPLKTETPPIGETPPVAIPLATARATNRAVTLARGTVVTLTEANHPSWNCRITVR